VAAYNIRYFEAQIMRYVTRWQKKNGVQDVEKAFHYLDKLEELIGGRILYPGAILFENEDAFQRFIHENEITPLEQEIIRLLLTYKETETLVTVRLKLQELLEKAKALAASK
jgi:hypothetical protein